MHDLVISPLYYNIWISQVVKEQPRLMRSSSRSNMLLETLLTAIKPAKNRWSEDIGIYQSMTARELGDKTSWGELSRGQNIPWPDKNREINCPATQSGPLQSASWTLGSSNLEQCVCVCMCAVCVSVCVRVCCVCVCVSWDTPSHNHKLQQFL